ncbi:MAG: hypothetical protein L0H59_10310 [Tomitella sp.]|nr:hypothetical protein [Tomitella sp.]
MTDDERARTNNTSAVLEAQSATLWRSVGVDVDRSDRMAASGIGGAVLGTGVGAAAAGTVPAILGGLLGGGLGTQAGTVIGATFIPGIGWVAAAPIGAGLGAGIGATAAGTPPAILGGILGGGIGYAVGTAYGAGETADADREPIDIPDIDGLNRKQWGRGEPIVDKDYVEQETRQMADEWSQDPAGAAVVDVARDIADQAPSVVESVQADAAAAGEQVRDTVATVPDGQAASDVVTAQTHVASEQTYDAATSVGADEVVASQAGSAVDSAGAAVADAVAAVPGGQDVIDAVDEAAADPATQQIGQAVNDAATAIGDGLAPAATD